jgi:hypothetical protein
LDLILKVDYAVFKVDYAVFLLQALLYLFWPARAAADRRQDTSGRERRQMSL